MDEFLQHSMAEAEKRIEAVMARAVQDAIGQFTRFCSVAPPGPLPSVATSGLPPAAPGPSSQPS
eukprot:3857703-Prorocentrum_lima.AAC.1